MSLMQFSGLLVVWLLSTFFSPNYLQPWYNALRIASGETV